MAVVSFIALAVVVLSLVVIIILVVRKFPQLSQIDTETLPETQEEKVKDKKSYYYPHIFPLLSINYSQIIHS